MKLEEKMRGTQTHDGHRHSTRSIHLATKRATEASAQKLSGNYSMLGGQPQAPLLGYGQMNEVNN
jgi:hypothetical protein